MKGILSKILFCLGCFILFFSVANAETFYEGDYINGEYINKVIDGKTYYMTMQYIEDNKGNIVYCLEPFTKFIDGKSYTEYSGDLVGYKNLSEEQKRKISLIIYYGYGYGNRTSSKWYVVTQYLVWKVVDNGANIYFTDTLNGKKITKYSNEEKAIMTDVNNHDLMPSFIKDYSVDYEDSLLIEGLNKNYEIISSDYAYGYNNSGNIIFTNILSNGEIKVRKISNIYDNNVTIYDSSNSQDVIKPGNVVNELLSFSINVKKGDITIDIRDDDSIYTIESDFADTCYEISNDESLISTVCTGDEPLIYKTDDLAYGDYYIKQVSVGIGYLVDSKVYEISINEDNPNPEIILYNKLLRNDIEIVKYACKNEECIYEENAIFEVYDKNGNLVDNLITDNNGYSFITLGYGAYSIKQVEGIEGYTISDEYSEKIVDEETIHYKEIINNYIEEGEVLGEYVEIPNTKVDSEFSLLEFLGWIWAVFKDIFAILG